MSAALAIALVVAADAVAPLAGAGLPPVTVVDVERALAPHHAALGACDPRDGEGRPAELVTVSVGPSGRVYAVDPDVEASTPAGAKCVADALREKTLAVGATPYVVVLAFEGARGAPPVVRETKAATITGSLTRDEIQAVIKGDLARIRFCYERALVDDPALAGKVVYRFVIKADGRVGDVWVDDATFANRAARDCMDDVVFSWRFPPPRGGGQVFVTYPFVFSGAEPPATTASTEPAPVPASRSCLGF